MMESLAFFTQEKQTEPKQIPKLQEPILKN
jgi:hypothetical protein